MTRYEYDLDEMQVVEDMLRKYHKSVNDKLTEVESIISTVRGQWNSGAAKEYEARHTNWVKQSQLMAEQLDAIDEWLDRARTSYDQVMKTNTGMFVQGQ